MSVSPETWDALNTQTLPVLLEKFYQPLAGVIDNYQLSGFLHRVTFIIFLFVPPCAGGIGMDLPFIGATEKAR